VVLNLFRRSTRS